MSKKINIKRLFKKYKFEVLKHFLISTIGTVSRTIVCETSLNIFRTSESIKDYAKLFPEKIDTFLPFGLRKLHIEKPRFILLGFSFIIFHSFFSYLERKAETELRIKSGHFIKNELLDKFRKIPAEKRDDNREILNQLIENDLGEFSSN
jgi:hypothetical protein